MTSVAEFPWIFLPTILSFFYQEKGEFFRFSFSLSSVDPSNFVKQLYNLAKCLYNGKIDNYI